MTKKRIRKRQRTVSAERRVDVTRLEFEHLLETAQRNSERIQRLEMSDAIQLKRTAELQVEINELRKALHLVSKQST
jgi:hypothetical protein